MVGEAVSSERELLHEAVVLGGLLLCSDALSGKRIDPGRPGVRRSPWPPRRRRGTRHAVVGHLRTHRSSSGEVAHGQSEQVAGQPHKTLEG